MGLESKRSRCFHGRASITRSLARGKLMLGFFLFLGWIFPSVLSMQRQNLTSSHLIVDDTLVSPSGQFQLGIFNFKNGKYYLCIRFAASTETVVWVANRDNGLEFSGSYLKLEAGNLQLLDQNGTNPWNSHTTTASVARLLDTGNLVLEDNDKNQIWNSFNSSITDTLLPGQYLYENDSRQNTLTSWRTTDDPSSGDYTFGWGTRANVSILQLEYCPTCNTTLPTGGVYIPAPDVVNPHIISNVDSVYFHPTLGGLYFPPSPSVNSSLPFCPLLSTPDLPLASTVILSDFQQSSATTGVLKRLTLDTDGGLRIWQWTEGKWTAVANWVVNERGTQCFTMGTCGPFGLCQMTPPGSLDRVQCTCPEGFEPIDPTDVSRGCNQIVPLNGDDYCNTNNTLELDGIDMPWVGDYNFTVETDADNCTAKCLQDCKCTGVVYSNDEQRCWKKEGNLYNLGYPTVALHGTDRNAIIKIAKDQPLVHDHKSSKLWILGPVLGGLFGIGIGMFCLYRFGNSLPQTCGEVRNGRNHPGVPDHFSGPDNAPPQPLVGATGG